MTENDEAPLYDSIEDAIAGSQTQQDPPSGDPPAGDPPAGDPPSGDPPPANDPPAVDQRLATINEVLGTSYASIDEVNSLKSEIAEIPKYKEFADYKNKYEEIASVVPKPKFANSKLEELNSFASVTNIDDDNIFRDIKRYTSSEDKDHIEALVIAEIIKEPSLAEDKEMLRMSIEQKFNLDTDYSLDDEAEEKRISLVKFNLKREAGAANQLINDTMQKVTDYSANLSGVSPKEVQEKAAANQLQWKSVVSDSKFKEMFKSLEIEVPLGKTEDGVDLGSKKLNIPLSDDDRKMIEANINGYVSTGAEYNEDNYSMITETQQLVAKLNNFNGIVKAAVDEAIAAHQIEWVKKYHNPSSTQRVETPVKTREGMTSLEIAEDMILNGRR
jgi:hypothetical protein